MRSVVEQNLYKYSKKFRTKLSCKAAEIAATRTLKAQFFVVCRATHKAFYKKIPPTEITTFHTCDS